MSLEDTTYKSDLVYFDPGKIRFFRRDGDALRLTVHGDRTHLKVAAARAYPLSDPHHFVGIRDMDGNEIGMIRDMRELDHESRAVLEEDLRKRYFTPIISRFVSIKHEFGAVYFIVDTDKGRAEFIVRGLRENIQEISPGRYLITDVDGNRFELPDSSQLDTKSLLMWERVV